MKLAGTVSVGALPNSLAAALARSPCRSNTNRRWATHEGAKRCQSDIGLRGYLDLFLWSRGILY
eukprot:5128197-Amphidinium_carterae.1